MELDGKPGLTRSARLWLAVCLLLQLLFTFILVSILSEGLSQRLGEASTDNQFVSTSIRWVTRMVWGLSLVSALLTIALMWFYSRHQQKISRQFANANLRISVGELDLPTGLPGDGDHWADLRMSMREMTTRLKNREGEVTRKLEQLQAVLSSMVEGVLSIDPAGYVIQANQAAANMLAIERSHLLGRRLLEVIRIPEFRAAIEGTQLQRQFSSAEFLTLSTPKRQLSVRVSPIQNPQESGVSIVLQDVTELRTLERMRRDFVANVSHELKTPLASIMAYAETLRSGAINDPPHNMEFVEQIEKQAGVLNSQIQDLMELARVEAGESNFCSDEVPVNLACQHCAELLRELAARADVTLVLELSPQPTVVIGNHEALATVITNLLTNAINYTPRQGNIRLETSTDDQHGIVRVIDTGIGIEAAEQTRIFERFYRVDKARSREKGGTGLGLAIVKHLVQAMNGTIELDSRIGHGSAFTVRLPLRPGEGDVVGE